MCDLTCPYCEHEFDYDGDSEVKQDSQLELECPKCDKVFVATAYWSLNFTDEEKAPCLNGEEHSFKSICRHPLIIAGKVGIRCEFCSEEKNIPWEDGERYGYDSEELKRDLSTTYGPKKV